MVKESFENLMMGNVSEDISEDNEAFDERLQQVQVALAKLAKDEKSAKTFDEDLAKIVQTLPKQFISFVAFLIDHEIPSLTVLSVLSVVHKKAHQVCKKEFARFVGEAGADFSTAGFSEKKVSDTLSTWWTFMILADHHSVTTRMKDVEEKPFHETFWQQIDAIGQSIMDKNEGLSFNSTVFEKKKKEYQGLLYR